MQSPRRAPAPIASRARVTDGKKILTFIVIISIVLMCYISQEYKMPNFLPKTIIQHFDATVNVVSRTDLNNSNEAATLSTVQNGQQMPTIQNGRQMQNTQNGRQMQNIQNGRVSLVNGSFISTKHQRNNLRISKLREKLHSVSSLSTTTKPSPHTTPISRLMEDTSSLVDGNDIRRRHHDGASSNVDEVINNMLGAVGNDNAFISGSSSSYDHADNINTANANDKLPPKERTLTLDVKTEVDKKRVSVSSNSIPNRVSVIILTHKRSGSSFLGEIFNQNENFTYFFEPLTSVTQGIVNHKIKFNVFDQYAHDIFNGILHRDFSHMPNGWWSGFVPRITCSAKTIAPYARLCGTHDNTERPLSLTEKMDLLDIATRKRRGLAIKTIRIQDLNQLKEMVMDPSLNVKIIHLVRDPRGVMNSRRKMAEGNLDLLRRKGHRADEILDLCQHMDKNLKVRTMSNWLNGRYKLVRYEDAAENPLKIAMDIYKFVGIELPPSVNAWLNKNTRYHSGDAYSRTRNSKQAASAWRAELDYRSVLEIQQKCANPMAKLGYVSLRSYFDLRNVKVNLLRAPRLTYGPVAQGGL